jgi:hypothetical protein
MSIFGAILLPGLMLGDEDAGSLRDHLERRHLALTVCVLIVSVECHGQLLVLAMGDAELQAHFFTDENG